MDSDKVIITCTRCGTKNRVPKDRLGDRPVCARCRNPLVLTEGMGKPVEITDQTFEREVFSYPGTALVDFWAPWCAPCRMVAPVLEDLALKYNGRVKIAKINVDQNPVAASRFQVQSIPTLIIFKNGKAVDRIIGALPGAQIEARLQAALES